MIIDDSEPLAFLEQRLDYERLGMPTGPAKADLRLGRMRRLMRRLGDPQNELRIVHVAGTKGKGSTSMMIAAVLSAAGIKTGLFTSPHLEKLEERYVVDGRMATPQELLGLIDAVRPTVEALDAEGPDASGRPLTFFEVTTAMGLLHFAKTGCQAAVVEVGMGGRLDSTNVVRPVLSVITSISFDHVAQLGPTLGHIAHEKAGILKRNRPAVIGVRQPEALAAIQSVAEPRRCPLFVIDRDFRFQYEHPRQPLTKPATGQVSVSTWRSTWGPMPAPLPGEHQALNVALALASLDALAEADAELAVGPEAVNAAFADLSCPARVELVSENPWLVIDGAHNGASAEALAETLQTCFPDVPRTLVFGTSRDKDIPAQLRALLPLFTHVLITRYQQNPRAAEPEAVAGLVVEQTGRQPSIIDQPAQALEVARRNSPRPGLICVTGSLFLAAEARAALRRTPNTVNL